MSWNPGYTKQFRAELLQAVHNFSADQIKVAFLAGSANLSKLIRSAYSTTGELPASGGYVAGGYVITPTLVTTGDDPYWTFADLVVPGLSLTGWGGLELYNASKSNKTIALLQFTASRTFTDKDVTVRWPNPLLAAPAITITG